MNLKHTPGPWNIPNDHPLKHGCIKAVASEDLICRVECDLNHKGEQLANMRLISAAPDLLAAVHQAVDLCDLREGGTMALALAAIAKATGQPAAIK